MNRVVIDTNIIVSALMNANGAPRQIIRLALWGEITPFMGNALLGEYEDVMSREDILAKSILDKDEVRDLLNALYASCEWTSVYFLWRPNLQDEADNHLIELALAGGTNRIISANKRDFKHSDLSFPELSIQTAGEFLDERSL